MQSLHGRYNNIAHCAQQQQQPLKDTHMREDHPHESAKTVVAFRRSVFFFWFEPGNNRNNNVLLFEFYYGIW